MLEKENLEEDIKDFLSKKGAVELLCEIGRGGSRFKELSEALDISHSTLSKRLGEGEDALLIEVRAGSGEQGTINKYGLRPRGLDIWFHMMDTNALVAYQTLRDAQIRFDEKAEETREWAVENVEGLGRDSHGVQDLEFVRETDDTADDSDEESNIEE